MSDRALQRTLRRGIALLLIPLCSLVAGMDEYVWSGSYGMWPDSGLFAAVFGVIPWILLFAALAYVVGSVLIQAFAAPWIGAGPQYDDTEE